MTDLSIAAAIGIPVIIVTVFHLIVWRKRVAEVNEIVDRVKSCPLRTYVIGGNNG